MKKIVFGTLTAAAATAFVAVPASAQDADHAFNGPRVEGVIGYDITKAGSSIDDDANQNNDQSMEGFSYGVGVGYDIDFGKFVVGPEAEVVWSTADTEYSDGDFEGFGAGNVSANRDLYLGARAGYKVTPSTLLYVKGGYTNAKFNIRDSSSGVDTNRDLDTDGWRVGAGVEHMLNKNMYVKAEYRYSNYQRAEVDYTADYADGQRFDVDFDRHQIMVGAGLRF